MAIALTIDYLEDFERDERGRIIRLRIPADRIKNGAEIDKPVSVNLDRQIRAHLAWYRPHLTGSRSQWLFPSPHGGPLSLQAVIECVRAADPFDQIPGKLRRALHHAKQVRPVDRRNLVTGE
jgi:hypothetical protein